MYKSPKWLKRVFNFGVQYRYVLVLIIMLGLLTFGLYLYYVKEWPLKDTAQVCTGFLLALTIFFAALNYELIYFKTKTDNKAAKEVLTFNIACEWYKTPVKDYQITSIAREELFSRKKKRSIKDFVKFIDDPKNIDYKEALKGILNYFETISAGVCQGIIDKDFIKEFHLSIFKAYYVDYHPYIYFIRVSKNDNSLWEYYTNLVEEWVPEMSGQMAPKFKSSIII